MHSQNPHRILFSLRSFLSSTPFFPLHRLSSSWLSQPGNPLLNWPPLPNQPNQLKPDPNPNPNPIPKPTLPSFSPNDFSLISNLFTNPSISPGSQLHSELNKTGIKPGSSLLRAIFDHFSSSSKLLHSVYLWAEDQPGFEPDSSLFDDTVNALAKLKEFDSAWSFVLERIDEKKLVSVSTFAILIRRYARAGMHKAAIRTFEFAKDKKSIVDSESEMSLFAILIDSLCKEGSVREASEYFLRRKETDVGWVPPIRVYNIMLNGWFRARKLKHAERLWEEMKKEKVRPSVVTYGTLVEGYCRMRRVETALEMIGEMTKERIEPNAIVYNPIIDALAEAGRFKEALGMIERFHVLQIGPTLSTYNSLVKGFCKAGDLEGASKILKKMISRGFLPTPTTYNYFFRYFARCGKVDEGMNLYSKMIESGHNPDRLTYHLVLKMLCEVEKLELAVQVSKEMRHRGYDMDLATSTMLTHLLCKMHRLEEAFAEFEDMIRRGIVPQYLTFQRLNVELKRQGMTEMARKLCQLMSTVPHSTNLPNTYGEVREDAHERRKSIIQKAKAVSDLLKDPKELDKLTSSSENAVSDANCLIEGIRKKIGIK